MLTKETTSHGGLERTYHLTQPTNDVAPLVFVLHGGGGRGDLIARITGFDAWCQAHGFIGCFPDGIDKNWNDGRDLPERTASRENIDDVGFLTNLIDQIQNVDRERVYIVGASNGAMLGYRAAIEQPKAFAAIASVIGQLPIPFAYEHQPTVPMPVLFMLGTEDPICPFEGGTLTIQREKAGQVMSAAESVDYWLQANQCAAIPDETLIAQRTDDQPMNVWRETYGGGLDDSEVVLYRVEGGGHTWPGGEQYAPEFLIGKTCRAFSATDHIGEFLLRHRRANS